VAMCLATVSSAPIRRARPDDPRRSDRLHTIPHHTSQHRIRAWGNGVPFHMCTMHGLTDTSSRPHALPTSSNLFSPSPSLQEP
jgi:hypothetical protein